MLTNAINSLFGVGLNLLGLLTAFLPDFPVDSLPLVVPGPVLDGLAAVNWFVPIGQLITVFNVWVGCIVLANVAFALRSAAAGKE